MEQEKEALEYLVNIGKSRFYEKPATIDGGQPFIVRDKELVVEDVEKFLSAPTRARHDYKFTEAGSLVAYLNDHKTAHTHVFASLDALTVRAVIDHTSRLGENAPAWGDHNASLCLTKTNDWAKWEGNDEKPMSQSGFADFLEEMDHTIVGIDAASLIELVTKMRTTSTKKFTSNVSRQDGSFSLEYKDERDVADTWKMPDTVMARVAPFRGADEVDVTIRVRFRVKDGSAVFFYSILRPDRIVESAFKQVCDAVAAGSSLGVLQVK